MLTRERAKSVGGFTLIEVMIAIMVFSLLMVIFAMSIPLSEKAALTNGQYAQAISLCQHKIDQMRAVGYGRLNYTDLNTADIVDDTPTSSPFQFAVQDSVSSYLISPTTSITVSNYLTGKIMLVTVTITWKATSYETRTCTMTLSALIANTE